MVRGSFSPKTPSSGNSAVDEEAARQVRKRLDEVVGTRFDEARGGLASRLRHGAAKWIIAAMLAVGTAGLIVYTLESHRLPSDEALKAAAQRKPVEIVIVPASKNP